jgi:hypothetical protein
MTDETQSGNHGHGGYEQSDINVAGVLYFLLGLAVFGVIAYFLASGLYSYLDKQTEAQQAPVSPLVAQTTEDTRHLPPEYKTDARSTDYEKYLKKNFPAPQLETDERSQLNRIITGQEETLSTYDYVDRQAGTVRIPIDRAMDLIVARGLPTRGQGTNASSAESKAYTKGTKSGH